MDNLIRFEAKKTPYVFLDQDNGFIELKSKSYMEDSMVFYDPIMEWIYEYVRHPKDTSVNIDLEFFNTSSAKILLIIIKTLSKVQNSGYKCTVNWFYDDDDDEIRDSGLSFSIMSHAKFNMFQKSSRMVIDGPDKENE
jgi:hypothetical protein